MAEQKSTSPTLTVACKIGVPWIDFHVCEKTTIQENTQTGVRDVVMWVRTKDMVRIRGTAYPRGEPPDGFPERPQYVLGYALTRNVRRDHWELLIDQRKKDPLFVNGMVFGFERDEDIRSRAKDYDKQLSGLEPIQRTKDTLTDPRIPKSLHSGISALEPAPRATAA